MRRFLIAALTLLAIAVSNVGCMNIARLGCECKNFYVDIQRTIFGIDYPHGIAESSRQKYIGIPEPGNQPICDD